MIDKSSVKKIIWPQSDGKPHGIWLACHGSPREARMAEVRARFMTGRYTCAGSAWIRGPLGKIELCQMCKNEPETLQHLMVSCQHLNKNSNPIKTQLLDIFRTACLPTPENSEEMISLLLNGDCFYSENSKGVIRLHKTELRMEAQHAANRVFGILDAERQAVLNDLTS